MGASVSTAAAAASSVRSIGAYWAAGFVKTSGPPGMVARTALLAAIISPRRVWASPSYSAPSKTGARAARVASSSSPRFRGARTIVASSERPALATRRLIMMGWRPRTSQRMASWRADATASSGLPVARAWSNRHRSARMSWRASRTSSSWASTMLVMPGWSQSLKTGWEAGRASSLSKRPLARMASMAGPARSPSSGSLARRGSLSSYTTMRCGTAPSRSRGAPPTAVSASSSRRKTSRTGSQSPGRSTPQASAPSWRHSAGSSVSRRGGPK